MTTPAVGLTLLETVSVAEEQEAPEPADVVAGWSGFIVIIALVVATGFLIRSMSKRLRKIDFDEGPDDEGPGDEGTDDEGAGDEGADDEGGPEQNRPDGDDAGSPRGRR